MTNGERHIGHNLVHKVNLYFHISWYTNCIFRNNIIGELSYLNKKIDETYDTR